LGRDRARRATIGFLGDGDLLRPSEIVTAFESGTGDGESILEILEHGVRREGIEKVVSRFVSPATRYNPPPGTSSLRVLLGEDDSIDPKWNLKLIERLGCDVTRVAEWQCSSERVAARPVRCADGLQDAADRLVSGGCRDSAPGARHASKSADIGPDAGRAGSERDRCFSAGIDDVLNRPITPENLCEAVVRSRTSRSELKID
jgi:CheY-like chemotaxis protein